ncbi:nicotinate-nucleotide adenylyltransferase [Pseudothioclava nitratireducens]|jgi:nicotinate-nucleotide adenylyltransferase|uniref:nicotinate-nucleotide adenylyltransferase n=1 Tax=Pseudothioclava nitratireducens TaxID=1928646 RepID=UPI0023DAD13B|nr:nicotinate-nucleotide adenylyltransferase [Defluviimonas nitratireducens]MDF1621111.1 nicotinate-nucleotide adenylyltransferase [Defluviimonas nitratireducens]
MKRGFPIARPGQRIGILGGSFDPAHEGHAHITRAALKLFGLDRVWWLVSPGNPLKAEGPAPMRRRLAQARRVMPDPRVDITDLECRLGTRYTAQTLRRLRALYPGVRFVWLMGGDNLVQFDRWDRWREIMEMVPVGVMARPGARMRGRRARAARIFRRAQLRRAKARNLALANTPAWAFLDVPLSDLSSSEIRARGEWKRHSP